MFLSSKLIHDATKQIRHGDAEPIRLASQIVQLWSGEVNRLFRCLAHLGFQLSPIRAPRQEEKTYDTISIWMLTRTTRGMNMPCGSARQSGRFLIQPCLSQHHARASRRVANNRVRVMPSGTPSSQDRSPSKRFFDRCRIAHA